MDQRKLPHSFFYLISQSLLVLLLSLSLQERTVVDGANTVPCPTDPTIQGYTSLQTLNRDQDTQEGPQTFVLCPQTTYFTKCTDEYLYVGKSDTLVKCGVDGSSSNNCTLAHTEPSCSAALITDTVVNVTLQGLTFTHLLPLDDDQNEQLARSGVINTLESEVAIEDCIFERLRMAADVDIVSPRGGIVTFQNCVFHENVGATLIFGSGGVLSIQNTYARCNELTDHMIRGQNPFGIMEVESSCFVDNYFNQAIGEAEFRTNVTNINNFQTGSQKQNDAITDISCYGISQTVNGINSTCFAFDSFSCPNTVDTRFSSQPCPQRRLTRSPTMTPTEVPTPSAATTTFLKYQSGRSDTPWQPSWQLLSSSLTGVILVMQTLDIFPIISAVMYL